MTAQNVQAGMIVRVNRRAGFLAYESTLSHSVLTNNQNNCTSPPNEEAVVRWLGQCCGMLTICDLSIVRATAHSPARAAATMTIEAWYMDDSDADQRLPHKREPNLPVSSEALIELGVLQWSLSGSEDDEDLAKIRSDRGYSYKDVVDIHKDRMPGYEAKLKTFFEEHIHTDEEIRYVLDGRLDIVGR